MEPLLLCLLSFSVVSLGFAQAQVSSVRNLFRPTTNEWRTLGWLKKLWHALKVTYAGTIPLISSTPACVNFYDCFINAGFESINGMVHTSMHAIGAFIQRVLYLKPLWPDLPIFCTMGTHSKLVATIILPKSPTLLVNFCKGVKNNSFF